MTQNPEELEMSLRWLQARKGGIFLDWSKGTKMKQEEEPRPERRWPGAEKLTLEKGGSPDEKAGRPHLSPWAPLRLAVSLGPRPCAYLDSMSLAERPPAKMQSVQQSGWLASGSV